MDKGDNLFAAARYNHFQLFTPETNIPKLDRSKQIRKRGSTYKIIPSYKTLQNKTMNIAGDELRYRIREINKAPMTQRETKDTDRT